jgi:hypothetical protein
MVGKPRTLSYLCVVILLFFSGSLSAQSDKPEVFVHLGTFHAGSDEGRIGRAASLGGGVTIPISRRLAAELDIQTSRLTKLETGFLSNLFYTTRRTLILPNLLYRRGNVRAYGFVGGGLGVEFVDSTTRDVFEYAPTAPIGWREVEPGVFELKHSDTRQVLFAPSSPWQKSGKSQISDIK